jgi:TonB family protein
MAEDKNTEALIVVDGRKPYFRGEVTLKRDEVASAKALRGKEATDKYGEEGTPGVIEITTRQQAAETGMYTAPPASRLRQTRDPNDYPAFQGGDLMEFQEWVASRVSYPGEALSGKIEGWVSVNYTISPDGIVSSTATTMSANPVLSDEVIRVIKSSPKWDPPKNKETAKPYNSTVTLKFELPRRIIADPPFVVVEAMPMYPGGDGELLNFIKNNTKYPGDAAAELTEGRVIVRFIVTTEGKTEGITVLKGIGPLFDAEAVRVVSLLEGWKPGMQNGKAVNTWYMVPVNFSVPQAEK